MKKLKLIVDSFGGYTKEFLEKKDIHQLPTLVFIDGKEIRDTEIENTLEIVNQIDVAVDAKTSQPPVGEVEQVFKKYSKEYEQVVFIPLQKNMSSTYSTAFAISRQYKNVHVVDTSVGAEGFINMGQIIKDEFEKTNDIEQAIEKAKAYGDKCLVWLIPSNLKALERSGRIKGFKKIILNTGRFVPRIFLTPDGLKPNGIKRGFKKAMHSAIEKSIDKINKRKEQVSDYMFTVQHSFTETKEQTIEMLKMFKEILHVNVMPAPLGPIVHAGKGSIGLMVCPLLK